MWHGWKSSFSMKKCIYDFKLWILIVASWLMFHCNVESNHLRIVHNQASKWAKWPRCFVGPAAHFAKVRGTTSCALLGGGGGFRFWIFTPKTGEDNSPIWRLHIFSNGLVQPPTTVGGRNPAPVGRSCILIIYGVWYIPGGDGFLPSTVVLDV